MKSRCKKYRSLLKKISKFNLKFFFPRRQICSHFRLVCMVLKIQVIFSSYFLWVGRRKNGMREREERRTKKLKRFWFGLGWVLLSWWSAAALLMLLRGRSINSLFWRRSNKKVLFVANRLACSVILKYLNCIYKFC